jgi:peptidyl-prolyl cis-trans isomerase B (cyclophilin B)
MEAVLYDSTPKHRDNFVKLVQEGFYDDLLFHRVIQWFMIQWGDPDSRGAASGVSLGRWWPWYQIDAEIDTPHYKWTLAAARTWWPSNPEKRSSWSQFYIVQWTPQTQESLTMLQAQKWITYTPTQIAKYLEAWGTPMLDNDYTVFGEITVWLDVIDAIAAVQTAPGDRPIEDITMKITIK